ncbi:hypothetical protein ACFO3J_24040 [Streptomyces polygonati]|uniref:Uncharacterized protein n=1 Tax=Streptomyces polygonati TaxID=1617087 RepID=A0ABV8HRC1_9ACTN
MARLPAAQPGPTRNQVIMYCSTLGAAVLLVLLGHQGDAEVYAVTGPFIAWGYDLTNRRG